MIISHNTGRLLCIFFITITALLSACGGSSDNPGNTVPAATRPFYMGFTPWPYDNTVAATTGTYTLIQDHGDLVAHHLMEGIPWQEALDDATLLPAGVEAEVSSRIAQTQSSKITYLAIDALNSARDNLAPYWDAPATSTWDLQGYDFDAIQVADAYSKFALRMINRFNPAYFSYASEVSELMLKDPVRFQKFKTFASRVYAQIKAVYPNLPLMVSLALKTPGSADSQTITTGFADIADYVDMVGISVYPYAFYEHSDRGDPANLPADWLSQITTIAPGKSYAITETGWIAEDLEIAGYGYSEQSDATKQNIYLQELLREAEDLSAEFIVWFTIVDYDSLWSNALGESDLSKIWKDTGLIDGLLNPRPALTTWDEAYALDHGS